MTFAHRLKTEICENRAFRGRSKIAQGYGLLLFGSSFSRQSISIHTEHEGIAQLFCWYLQDVFHLNDGYHLRHIKHGNGKTVYEAAVEKEEDRESILFFLGYEPDRPIGNINRSFLKNPEDIGAFVSGVFMACGNMSDPSKNYHIEFVIREQTLCSQLSELIGSQIDGPKQSHRRGQTILYYKESRQIEELMALMGASRSCMELMEIGIIKGIRNKANRVTNCETANIDKTISASARQIEDIRLVLSQMRSGSLPDELLELAALRLENPEMSLSELAGRLQPPLSRSGVNHRLKRLSRMAEELKENSRRNT